MIKPLTSLRFFFAFLVFLSHYIVNGKSLFFDGYIGVSFFFMLSGFILAYSYKQKFQHSTVTKTDFYVARFARIYPLHLLTLFVSCLLIVINGQLVSSTFKVLPINLTLLQSFIPLQGVYFSFNAVSWSISDEMFFYCLFPFLILLLNKLKWQMKSLFAMLVIGGYLIMIWVIPQTLEHALFYVNPLLRFVDFMIGMALFYFWERFHPLSQANSYQGSSFFSNRLTATAWEVGSLLLLVVFVYFSQYVPQVYRYASYYWVPMAAIIFIFAQPVSCNASAGGGYVSRILSLKWLVLLGEVSFGFYMIHYTTLPIVNAILKRMGLADMPWGYNFLVMVTVIILLSIASFYIFETPYNRYIKKKYKSWKDRHEQQEISL